MVDVLARTASVFLLAGSLFALGCAENIAYTPLQSPPHRLSARPVDAVDVFMVTPPGRPHTDIGLLRVVGAKPPPSTHTDVGFEEPQPVDAQDQAQGMIAALRQRAAEMGCDAILVTAVDSPMASEIWLDQRGGPPPSAQASCVVYKDAGL